MEGYVFSFTAKTIHLFALEYAILCRRLSPIFGLLVFQVVLAAYYLDMKVESLLFDNARMNDDSHTSLQFLPNQKDMDYCRRHNYVADRKTADIRLDVPSNRSARPFSLQRIDFEPHFSKSCTSVLELLDAVKYGQRQWIDERIQHMSSQKQESTPSYFVPYGCHIPVLSPDAICAVLEKFSHVVMLGDSLLRHVSTELECLKFENDFLSLTFVLVEN